MNTLTSGIVIVTVKNYKVKYITYVVKILFILFLYFLLLEFGIDVVLTNVVDLVLCGLCRNADFSL